MDARHDTERDADPIAALEARARIVRTACGDGEMVWHEWGSGEPLVLLHGGYGSWLHWLRNINPLARGNRVICADIPGLGDSAEAPSPYTPASIAAIVARGLDEVLGDAPAFDLTGFSFGALVAGHVALACGSRTRSLVLVGAGAMGLKRAPGPDLVRAEASMSEAERRATHRRNLAALMFHDPARIDDLALDAQIRNVRRARTRSRPFSRSDSLRRCMEQATARLAGIWGAHDVTAEPWIDDRAALFEAIQPGCRFEVIEDAGHWVMYEAPEAFDRVLLDVLAQTRAR